MMEETSRVVESPLSDGCDEPRHQALSSEHKETEDLRASLLASLIGEDTLIPPVSTYRSYDEQIHRPSEDHEEEEDEDLFGRIIVSDSGPSRSTTTVHVIPPPSSLLLSSSGLLETPFYGTSSGLFDVIDAEEEERALQLAKQRQIEEEERRRKKEEDERQKALEEAITKEQERQRVAEEREKQRLLKEKEDEQRRIQQEEQKRAYLAQQGTSPKTLVATSAAPMKDLRLNETGDLNHRPYDNISITSPTAPNIDAPFIGNTASVSQSGFLAHIADSKLSHLQQRPPTSMMTPVENLPTSSLQQAGYGWASYYYSTSGNTQQMNPTQRPVMSLQQQQQQQQQQHPLVSNTSMNPLSGGPSYTVPTGPSLQQQQQQQPHIANTGSAVEDGLSYAQRSQMRRNISHVSSTSSTVSQQSHHTTPRLLASKTAGMHNTPSYPVSIHAGGTSSKSSSTSSSTPRYNEKWNILFGPITVTDPILVQSPGLFAGPPYWTYAISVWQDENSPSHDNDNNKVKPGERIQLSGDAKMISSARRRFRHFVALEERLRRECPGAILPPRPDKHAIRAFEEVSASQSSDFALQRAVELEAYLNELRMHPMAGNSSVLKLFLTLPDHIGVAWPEVSSSIITRLSEFGTSAAVKVAEGASQVLSELNSDYQAAAGEDNAEILAMASSEGLRISSVLQAVPKLEGIVFLLNEHGEKIGICGLECQKLARQDLNGDKDMSTPFDILSAGLLLSGRKMKSLAADVGSNILPFQSQYKLCRYESMAFGDRRSALARRRDARKEADNKAQKLVSFQHSLNTMGKFGMLEKMEMEAALADENAVDAVREADEIGRTLQREVRRINEVRLKEWSSNLCSIVHGFCQFSHEQVEIWENCRDDFFKEYPMIHQSYLSTE